MYSTRSSRAYMASSTILFEADNLPECAMSSAISVQFTIATDTRPYDGHSIEPKAGGFQLFRRANSGLRPPGARQLEFLLVREFSAPGARCM